MLGDVQRSAFFKLLAIAGYARWSDRLYVLHNINVTLRLKLCVTSSQVEDMMRVSGTGSYLCSLPVDFHTTFRL